MRPNDLTVPRERMRNTKRIMKNPCLLLLPMLFGLGCGLTDPDTPVIAGTWVAQDDADGRWEFELSGTDAVSGTYLITFEGESFALRDSVTGQYDYPAVSLGFLIEFLDELALSCDFRGTMAESGQTIVGTAICAGDGESFASALDLRRES